MKVKLLLQMLLVGAMMTSCSEDHPFFLTEEGDGELFLNNRYFQTRSKDQVELIATYIAPNGLYEPSEIIVRDNDTKEEIEGVTINKKSKVYKLSVGKYFVFARGYQVPVLVEEYMEPIDDKGKLEVNARHFEVENLDNPIRLIATYKSPRGLYEPDDIMVEFEGRKVYGEIDGDHKIFDLRNVGTYIVWAGVLSTTVEVKLRDNND